MTEENPGYFELYITSNGTVQVSNDVKLKILHDLQERDMSLTEIAKSVSKAQSTISVHLDSMVRDRLICVHDDLQDSRKKYYTLTSLQFGKSVPSSDESREVAFDILAKEAQNPERMLRSIPRLIFLGFDGIGLNVDPMAKIMGFIHGASLSGSLNGPTLEDTIDNARDYLKEMGLGEVSIFSSAPLTIIVKDSVPLTEGAAGILTQYCGGFFSKIMEDATGRAYDLVSGEVFGSDFNYVRFVLEPKETMLSSVVDRQERQ